MAPRQELHREGLQPSGWKPKLDPNDPPAYAEARAAGFEAGKALIAKAEAEQLKQDVEWLADALGAGGVALPRGSSVNMTWEPMRGIPRASHVTLWPLSPMTIEEAVRSGLFKGCGVDRMAYDRAVKELVL